MDRRDLLIHLGWPLVAGSIGGIVTSAATAFFTSRVQDRHGLSIAVVPSEGAVSPGQEYGALDPFGPTEFPTPTPGPESRYSYTVLIRNDGDYSELGTIVSIRFLAPEGNLVLVEDPHINWSSPLLAGSVEEITSPEPEAYGIRAERLNPGEWVSMQATWRVPVQVAVQARSETATASVFV